MTAFAVEPGLVPRAYCVAARRRLNLEIRRVGITAEQIREWQGGSFWPSLREEPVFNSIRDLLPAELWAETQILVRFPDEDDVEPGPPHLDVEPAWARDRYRYGRIFSVELTDTPLLGGQTVLHTPAGPHLPFLKAGDVLSLAPDVPHAGSPNRSGDVRMALIFRTLVQR